MEVTSFLLVSVGSSTVQLHDSLGSRRACACSEAGFSSENSDRAWGVFRRRAALCCAVFLWEKGLNAQDIHKEMFPVYCGKCLSRKAFTTGSRNSIGDVRKSQMMHDQVPKCLRQQSRDFYAAGFDAVVKRWDKCINAGGGYVEKYIFFFFQYHMCYSLYPFVSCFLTLPPSIKVHLKCLWSYTIFWEVNFT
jgi:hypothetical protein